MSDESPIRVIVVHRGDPPRLTPDPWGPDRSSSTDSESAGLDLSSRTFQLARAIAASAGWRERPPALLIVRDDPEPVIAAVGRFGPGDVCWLEAARQQLFVTLPHVRWLDARAFEAACDRLATELVDRFGASDARSFRYVAVPRGGLIVLGHLAYRLDLPHHRLLPREAGEGGDDEPLVIVDDIVISGLRLSSFVENCGDPRLIVATLHAHPALGTAFQQRHPRVEAFVSAHELQDLAPATYGDGYEAWRERWRARGAPGTVWIGQTERVVFPWGEPDTSVWNDVLEREEAGWRLIPPERVLKRGTDAEVPVQRMRTRRGPLAPTSSVVAGEFEGRIVIGHLDDGRAFVLEGVAAETWRALVATGDVAAAAAAVSKRFTGDIERIHEATETFAGDLIAADVLNASIA